MKDEEQKDLDYIAGERMVWRKLFAMAAQGLGFPEPTAGAALELRHAELLIEMEDARAALRTLCEEHGDNDWDETLHLADVIDKHLGRYLQ